MADGEHGMESDCCNSGRLLGVRAVASRRSSSQYTISPVRVRMLG